MISKMGQRHCLIGFLNTASDFLKGLADLRSILRARFRSTSCPGVSAAICQFPVLLGRRPGAVPAAAAAAAAALSAGSGV